MRRGITPSAFHEPEVEVREPVEHAIDDHAGQPVEQRNRHAKGSRSRKVRHGVEAQMLVVPSMDRENASELLSFRIQWPVLSGGDVLHQAVGRNHAAYHAQVSDAPAEFGDSFVDNLHGKQANTPQARVVFHEGVVQPVLYAFAYAMTQSSKRMRP